ncbi:unnamed protein product [Adineta ricciae]|uniref:Uncharacterized protein n=1 Tax=Adineta ricciae TaxID=249248 RepID=A0A814X066_ADIRI|nr:unnamed protein product [Adineta ricciae]CAF1387558.1 unnamed protein product [Adineta ricciae]
MTTFLTLTLSILAVITLIVALGLIMAYTFIKRTERGKVSTNVFSSQLSSTVIDVDDLPDTQQKQGITVISNDIIDHSSHRHQHLQRRTISVIDSVPSAIDQSTIVPDMEIVDPLTEKITLEY